MTKIIIVDDEVHLAAEVARALHENNSQYDVMIAQNAEDALKQMESSPSDVVVTDIKLPRMSGIEFSEIVKAKWPNTAIIVMTAYGTQDVIKSAFKAGALFYIEKPFKVENLGNMIKMAGMKRANGAEINQKENFKSTVA